MKLKSSSDNLLSGILFTTKDSNVWSQHANQVMSFSPETLTAASGWFIQNQFTGSSNRGFWLVLFRSDMNFHWLRFVIKWRFVELKIARCSKLTKWMRKRKKSSLLTAVRTSDLLKEVLENRKRFTPINSVVNIITWTMFCILENHFHIISCWKY